MNNLARKLEDDQQENTFVKPTSSPKIVKLRRDEQVIIKNGKGYLFTKRLIDIIGALFGLIVFSPVFLIVTILIKIENPKGNVIFAQERVGIRGSTFKMYKFRSMVVDAEEKLDELLVFNEISGAMFKIKDDPRVTKIGKFIRRTSIDELPQFVNVLKGDMSIVGPRPALNREVEQYTPLEMKRLEVTPGCTGLWQISGRSNLDFHEMVELDLEYSSKRSLLLDIKIIIKTFVVVLRARDSY